MVWKHLSHFLSSSFFQNTTDYHLAKRLFFLLLLLLIFNLLCCCFFLMFIIWHKPGRMYVDLTNSSHHVLVTLKTCQCVQYFFFIFLFLFYYLFWIITDMKIILLNLVTIAIHLFHFRRWFAISTDWRQGNCKIASARTQDAETRVHWRCLVSV